MAKGRLCRRSRRFFFRRGQKWSKISKKFSFKKRHEAHQIDRRNALNAKMYVGGGGGGQEPLFFSTVGPGDNWPDTQCAPRHDTSPGDSPASRPRCPPGERPNISAARAELQAEDIEHEEEKHTLPLPHLNSARSAGGRTNRSSSVLASESSPAGSPVAASTASSVQYPAADAKPPSPAPAAAPEQTPRSTEPWVQVRCPGSPPCPGKY